MASHVKPWKYFGSHNTPQPFQKESMIRKPEAKFPYPLVKLDNFPKAGLKQNEHHHLNKLKNYLP